MQTRHAVAVITFGVGLGTSACGTASAPGSPSPSAAWSATAAPACSPSRCLAYQGMTVEIQRVERNFASWPGGFHVVRVTVAYKDLSGEHQADPEVEFSVRDPVGVWQGTGFWLEGQAPGGCLDPLGPSPPHVLLPEQLAPGASSGPFDICFKAGGDPSGPLALAWEPQPATGLGNGPLGAGPPDGAGRFQCVPSTYTPPATAVVFTNHAEACAVLLISL